ncbi:MAG TPA: hypothetical protein VN766_17235 [Stellaceae bacterium]|nr:hypothetical protein [Stellaceae bacterium]
MSAPAQFRDVLEPALPFGAENLTEKNFQFGGKPGRGAAGRNREDEIASSQHRGGMHVAQRRGVLDMKDRSRRARRTRKPLALRARHIRDKDQLRLAKRRAIRPMAQQPLARRACEFRARRCRVYPHLHNARFLEPGEAAQRHRAIADQRNAQP